MFPSRCGDESSSSCTRSPVTETDKGWKDEHQQRMNQATFPSCAHKRGKILEPSDVLQLFKRSFGHVKDVKDVTDSDSFQTLNKILVKAVKAPSSFSGLRCQEWPDRENLKFISTTSWSLELNLRAQFSASNIWTWKLFQFVSGHEECHDSKLAKLPYVSLQFVTVVFNIFQPFQPFQPFAVSILQVWQLAVSCLESKISGRSCLAHWKCHWKTHALPAAFSIFQYLSVSFSIFQCHSSVHSVEQWWCSRLGPRRSSRSSRSKMHSAEWLSGVTVPKTWEPALLQRQKP